MKNIKKIFKEKNEAVKIRKAKKLEILCKHHRQEKLKHNVDITFDILKDVLIKDFN